MAQPKAEAPSLSSVVGGAALAVLWRWKFRTKSPVSQPFCLAPGPRRQAPGARRQEGYECLPIGLLDVRSRSKACRAVNLFRSGSPWALHTR